ncbi:MAG: hypothetical protein WDW38_001566 [Sanguina aurantia]
MARVAALCEGGTSCAVVATNTFLGGDPLYGVGKYDSQHHPCMWLPRNAQHLGRLFLPRLASLAERSTLGEQDGSQMPSVFTGFMQQGFTFERLGVAIYNVVPCNHTRLVTTLQSGFVGCNTFHTSAAADDSMMGLSGLHSNDCSTPKAQTFRLMSSVLGLGQAVLTVVNGHTDPTTLAFSFAGLQADQAYDFAVWEASATCLAK